MRSIVGKPISPDFEFKRHGLVRTFWNDALISNSVLLQESMDGLQITGARVVSFPMLQTCELVVVTCCLIRKVWVNVSPDQACSRIRATVNGGEDNLHCI
jgi:hypothetical protein